VPGVDKVETAASGEEVLARYPHEHPDLVLMDVRMPGLGGLEATRRLVQQFPEAKVIMLTAADDRDQVAAAVSSGARGYLLKDVSHEELCAAVAHALDGIDLVEPTLRRALASRDTVRSAPPQAQLTERELQVLTGMSQGKSNSAIGRELYLSHNTSHSHTKSIYRKLGASSRREAVKLARTLAII